MRFARTGALALALAAAACTPGVGPAPLLAPGIVRGIVLEDVAGVPVGTFHPRRETSKRIIIRPFSVLPPSSPRPLFVVDGRILKHAPASLDPRDIAKVHVLKNPAATKRYGMRAVGGAVLITTRR
jgi:TonB-dependent SusC/RagA subfamily outer membrane receptor